MLKSLPKQDIVLPDDAEANVGCAEKCKRKRKHQEMDVVVETASTTEILDNQTACSKYQGDLSLHVVQSRGLFFIVRAGGHVDMFAPIFR